jgi:hypothetical protein
MKKLLTIMCAVVLLCGVTAVQAAQYTINGVNPYDLTLETIPPNDCTTVTIALDPGTEITTPLLTAGMWITFDPAVVSVTDVQVYDGALTPALWDPGFTGKVPDADGPGTYLMTCGNFATVALSDLRLADVTLCCLGAKLNDTVNFNPVPGFDTIVGDTTLYDPIVAGGVINLDQVAPPCACDITGPAVVGADAFAEVTAQYNVSGNVNCTNPPAYVWSSDCTLGSIDQTGLLTVPATTDAECCTITVTDNANTDINTGQVVTCDYPICIEAGTTCDVEIALGRECPGTEIDDPAYNRPGRRGLAATCNDIIDFTVCSDCDPFDPDCLVWTVDPAEAFLSIAQIDDCCWRLTIDDSCDQLEKIKQYEVTVTDTCNNGSDSVIIEIGKVIVDVQDSTVDPQSGSVAVDIDLINPENHARALTMDIAECAGGEDNLVCTECTADPSRALGYTCTAAEQPDGSCRIALYSTDPSEMIEQGRGPIATVIYDAIDANSGDCVCLTATDIQISDQFNEDLCACQDPGEVCFKTCGDIYPQDCEFGGPCGDNGVCGDGVVDLFDILEAIDIILGLQEATLCQIGNADVPNGMPPYCGSPAGTPNCESDGDIDIFDVLVMIDKALGKANCCDYCNFGQIY